MKKNILFATILFFFFFGLSSAFSGEGRKNSKEQSSWETYNPEGEYVGTIKEEKERYIFYDKDEIKLKEKGKNEWKMYNQLDEFVGILKKEDRTYKFYDKQEIYLGLILQGSNELMPKGYNQKKKKVRKKKEIIVTTSDGKKKKKIVDIDDEIGYSRTSSKITAETAKLYLYVLKAIEKIE